MNTPQVRRPVELKRFPRVPSDALTRRGNLDEYTSQQSALEYGCVDWFMYDREATSTEQPGSKRSH